MGHASQIDSSNFRPRDKAGELAQQVTTLLDEVLGFELRPNDDPDSLPEDSNATRAVLELVNRAVKVLQAVSARFEENAEPDASTGGAVAEPSLQDIGAMISTETAAQEITNLAGMAAGELLYQGRAIETAVAGGERLRAVTAADGVVRELLRILIPLESALCEFLGLFVPRRVWPDLRVSLNVRRAFAELARGVAQIATPSSEDLGRTLAGVADLLLDLRRNPIYLSLRVEDRLCLGTLSQRLADWLEQPERLGEGEGFNLLSEVRACMGILRHVNWRSELREHDQHLAIRIVERLNRSSDPEISPETEAELGALLGRDDEVDALILDGNRQRAEWIPRLRHLLESFES